MPSNSRSSGPRAPPTREVQVSKQLSWLLRHGAESEGLKLDDKGFINAADVLGNRRLKSLKVTFAELRAVVDDNDKKRFTLISAAGAGAGGPDAADADAAAGGREGDVVAAQPSLPSDNPRDYLVRANQGHSIKVESEALLTPVTAANLPSVVVHGTTHGAWPAILAAGGLKAMGRNHVHFASGLPAGFQTLADGEGAAMAKDESGEGETAAPAPAPVISGMRNSSSVLIFVDLPKAIEAGVKFWLSDNGVILSEGDEAGLVRTAFFQRVEDRSGEGVLVRDGLVVKEAPEEWARKGTGRRGGGGGGGRGGRGGGRG